MPKFVNPESFPSSSELNIVFPKFFNNHDGKVFLGMTMLIVVLSHCKFLNLLVFDVISVMDVQGILC